MVTMARVNAIGDFILPFVSCIRNYMLFDGDIEKNDDEALDQTSECKRFS